MGKKKNVEISKKPLESTTIGIINEHKYGWIGILILFSFFIALIFFMPDINTLYQKLIGGDIISEINTPQNNNDNNKNEHDNEEEPEKKDLLQINEEASSEESNIQVDKFKISGNAITYNITNKGEKNASLKNSDLFLEFYTEGEELVQRIMLTKNIEAGKTISQTHTFNTVPSKYILSKIPKDDYTYLTLNEDDNHISKLTCTKDSIEITYTFNSDKLTKLDLIDNLSIFADDYNDRYSLYYTESQNYNNIDGVTSSFTNEGAISKYIVSVDYTKASNVTGEYFFTKDETPIVINFQMDAMEFTCR